jgi:hypothetical protein
LSARLPVAILSIAFAAVLILVGSRILVDYVKHRDNDTLIISQTCQQETLLQIRLKAKQIIN